MMGGTIERARHRWREILPQLGIETRFLTNKHGPCPLCGGKDRFRFDDRHGDGDYFCNQCGPGVGLILVQKKNGWDFQNCGRRNRQNHRGGFATFEKCAAGIKRIKESGLRAAGRNG